MLSADNFAVDTKFGEKIVEFRHGDITKVSDKVDMLIISAFKGDYTTTEKSIVGALWRAFSISVENLSLSPAIDLRGDLNTWISREDDLLEIKDLFFKRLMVVEIKHLFNWEDYNIDLVLNNIFASVAAAEVKRIRIRTILLPLIGTGDQGLKTEEVLGPLIKESIHALKTIAGLEKIIFCEKNDEKAGIIFSHLDGKLKRSIVKFTKEQKEAFIEPVISDLRKAITRLSHHSQSSEHIQKVVNRWFETLGARPFGSPVFGQFCRAFFENFLHFFGWSENGKEDSASAINRIVKIKNFASWVHSYLHIIRVTGNYNVHEAKNHRPKKIEFKDLLIALNSLLRLVEFWNEILEKKI